MILRPRFTHQDSVLLARATKAGKRIVYLETVEAQLAAIEPYATAADIKAILDRPAESKAQSRAMIAAYLAGDAKGLAALFDDKTFWDNSGKRSVDISELDWPIYESAPPQYLRRKGL